MGRPQHALPHACGLSLASHATGVWIVRSAAGDGKAGDAGYGSFVVRGGVGDLGGGGCTSDDEDGDEGTNEMFHSGILLKLYSRKKICLDKANEVTIGYIME
jgi:hypothetical protein